MLLPWRISKSKRFNLLSVTVMRLKLRSLYGIWQSSALSEPAPLSLSDGAKDTLLLLLLSPEFWVLRPESDADVFATHWGYAKRKRAIQTGKQSSRQIDQPTDRQGDRQTGRQTSRRGDGRIDNWKCTRQDMSSYMWVRLVKVSGYCGRCHRWHHRYVSDTGHGYAT